MEQSKPFDLDRIARIIFSIAVLIGIFYVLNLLQNALFPFFLALVIAYLIYPMVRFYQTKLRIKKRSLAVMASFLTFALFISGSLWLIVPSVKREFINLRSLTGRYLENNPSFKGVPDKIQTLIQDYINSHEFRSFLNSYDLKSAVNDLMPSISGLFNSAANILVIVGVFFIVLIYTLFILNDFETITKRWVNLVPIKFRSNIKGFVEDLEYGMRAYFRGQILIAFIVGVLFSIGFSIIGLPLAIVLGLFIGMLNIVPYLQLVGILPAAFLTALYSLQTDTFFWSAAWKVALVFVIVQLIQEIVLIPKIMGKVTGLNPAIIVLSLSIWGTLLGVSGLVIGLPLTSILLTYYKRYLKDEESPLITKEHLN